MDFSKINSLTDLLNENDKVKGEGDVVMALCKPVYQEDPSVGMNVAIEILTELLGFHDMVMKQAVEDGDATTACNWAIDMARIDGVITTLKDIQL
jgi:hypothetical protein